MSEAAITAEKRQSPRVAASIPVRYKVLRDGAEESGVGSVTCNLSTGGIRFVTSEPLSAASHLVLEFDIPAVAEPIKALSKVTWIKPEAGEDDSRYHVGSQFMEISGKDQELIAEYLRGH